MIIIIITDLARNHGVNVHHRGQMATRVFKSRRIFKVSQTISVLDATEENRSFEESRIFPELYIQDVIMTIPDRLVRLVRWALEDMQVHKVFLVYKVYAGIWDPRGIRDVADRKVRLDRQAPPEIPVQWDQEAFRV